MTTVIRLAKIGDGNRKDIRNAVEGARAAASSWGNMPAHRPGADFVLYCRKLGIAGGEFSQLIAHECGITVAAAAIQVESALQQWFTAAAWQTNTMARCTIRLTVPW
jgi:aldehyde dehydrogenase (NAD+)